VRIRPWASHMTRLRSPANGSRVTRSARR
jgi:hypothetical protein